MKVKKTIVLLPGDGIGPEVTRAAATVLRECAPEGGCGFSWRCRGGEVGCAAGGEAAGKWAAWFAQGHGAVCECASGEGAGAVAWDFSFEAGAFGRFGYRDCP